LYNFLSVDNADATCFLLLEYFLFILNYLFKSVIIIIYTSYNNNNYVKRILILDIILILIYVETISFKKLGINIIIK